MKFRKQGDKGYFDGVEAAIIAGHIYISPYINNKLYVYLERENLIISVDYFELLRILESIEKKEVKLIDKALENTALGVKLFMKFDEAVEVRAIIGWETGSVTATFNDKEIPINHGLDCEYNECIYTAINYFNNFIYFLKIRLTENSIEPRLYKINITTFINELIFYYLHEKFKLI